MSLLIRKATKQLSLWYSTPSRSPLVIFGPRQCGKTTLARTFAKKHYPSGIIEINFLKDARGSISPRQYASIFERSRDPRVILSSLSLLIGKNIDPLKDILLIDEIQECGSAYEALKNFKDDLPGFPVIATGSYLKLFLEKTGDISHPVGCTTEINLRPLSFEEFLENYNQVCFEMYQKINLEDTHIDENLHDKLMEALNVYLFTGGMPEVVFNYINMFQLNPVDAVEVARSKQLDLIRQYHRDLEKYARIVDIKKIKTIFERIPLYLEHHQDESVGRVQFTSFDEKKYSPLKSAFDYLRLNGLIIQTHVVNKPAFPLLVNRDKLDLNNFKAYFFDIGLLNAALDCPCHLLFNKDRGHYKGYIVENFVAQQLFCHVDTDHLFSYKAKSTAYAAEVEFLVSCKGEIIPIEVKSSLKWSRSKSLQSYIDRFNPKLAIKCCPSNLGRSDRFNTIPLYLIEKVFQKVV